jgi:DNA-binding NarL/FixJ family response regulator
MAWRQLVRYAALPQIEILILTMHDSETLIQELLEAGARSYLLKTTRGVI